MADALINVPMFRKQIRHTDGCSPIRDQIINKVSLTPLVSAAEETQQGTVTPCSIKSVADVKERFRSNSTLHLQVAWVQRWSGLVAFAAARSFAASLLSLPLHGTANVDGSLPDLSDVLAELRLDSPPHASRLPAR